ncbi:MAG TPA: hypothetical protein VNM90_14280 [Haliangium sp.]|nr:hypothetical protein [Haliangium sp.]
MRSSFAAHGRVMRLAILAILAAALAGSPASWAQSRSDRPAQKPARQKRDAKPAPAPKPDKAPAADADDDAAGETETAAVGGAPTASAPEPTAEQLEAMPDNLRLRRLEQRVQELKERAWRTKARVSELEEAVLGAGVGANATIVHVDQMGSSYELVQLVYNLDGTQIFARKADSGALDEIEDIEVLSGPLSPGSHTVSVLAVYQGRGYGVFKYMNKYKFTVRSSHTFTANEGKATRIEAVAFERGNVTTPIQQRPAIDFKISYGDPRKPEVKQ